MIGLFISGITAFPLETELGFINDLISGSPYDGLTHWIDLVYNGLRDTNSKYPFIAYGSDWLAFAHLILAILFVGPLRDPVRNVWVVEFGLIACVLIFPLAFIAGEVRQIPLFWRLIDCSFGVVGAAVLWPCYQSIRQLEMQIKPGKTPS
jgi:hypothetical protein